MTSLCLIDTAPRTWSPRDLATLLDVAADVLTEIELRAALLEIEEPGFAPFSHSEGPAALPVSSFALPATNERTPVTAGALYDADPAGRDAPLVSRETLLETRTMLREEWRRLYREDQAGDQNRKTS